MNDLRIIHENDDGGISILIPAEGISQERLIQDVPVGKKYLIANTSIVALDRTFRDAWEADFTGAPTRT